MLVCLLLCEVVLLSLQTSRHEEVPPEASRPRTFKHATCSQSGAMEGKYRLSIIEQVGPPHAGTCTRFAGKADVPALSPDP
jgi:hypothetical protein